MACDPQQVPVHRYVTTENIRAGDVILEEEPWMWSMACLNGKFEDILPDPMVCHYCLLSAEKLLSCSSCKSAWYCGSICQRADWTLRHKHGDCRMQKAIRQMKISKGYDNLKNSMRQHEFYAIIRRLLLCSASARLFSAKQRDPNGNPDSALWHAVLNTPSKTDGWVDVNHKLFDVDKSAVYTSLVRTIAWKDLPDGLIEKRILPSLVLLGNYEGCKKMVQDTQLPTTSPVGIGELALGACLEMAKFPNNCNPNAITVTEGRLVRMVALEDIPNLEAVRLSRLQGWFEVRFHRRSMGLSRMFGFDCYCARCCAGDSGETALFGLRCPKWAALYNATGNSSSGCDGIVTGLRRTDIDPIFTSEYMAKSFGADFVALLDESIPLSAEIMKQPPHARAKCQKCHARYDVRTMNMEILKLLEFMANVGIKMQRYVRNDYIRHELCTIMTDMGAEKYVLPTFYAYSSAEKKIFHHCLIALEDEVRFDVDSLVWMQRYARRWLARIESDGFAQLDLTDLMDVAGLHSYAVQILRRNGRRLGRSGSGGSNRGNGSEARVYEQTAEVLTRVATAALRKLRPLFVRG